MKMHNMFRLTTGTLALFAALMAGKPEAADAAAFTPGNIVAMRNGDGSASLTSAATAGFLDEYTTGGALVQSIPLPTATGSGTTPNPLTDSGVASSNGMITRSADGKYIIVPGYAASLGTAGVAGGSGITRCVGVVKYDGAVDTTTTFTDGFIANNFRSACSADGSALYLTGNGGTGNKGARYATKGATSTSTIDATPNARCGGVFGGNLYYNSQTVMYKQSGTPVTASAPSTITFSGTAPSSMYQFVFLTVPSGDVCYIADDGLGGILKYSVSGTILTYQGKITATSARGLSGSANGSTVTLFASTGGTGATGGGTIWSVTDTAANNAAPSTTVPSVIVTAGANKAFRGIAFAPSGPITYTVTYNGNGATAGAAPTDGASPYNSGATVAVAGNTGNLARTGYAFNGWNTAANGGGTNYAEASAFAIMGNTTLYAQWTINTYSVTYDANGGSAAPTDGNSPYNFNSAVTVLAAGGMAKSGYTFTNWNAAADGSGTAYHPGDTFNIAANTTFYAQWIVTLVPTDPTGTGTGSPSPAISGSNVTLTVNVTPGANPTSTGITVSCDLTAIGGGAAVEFNGQVDGTFTLDTTVAVTTSAGSKSIPITIHDAQGRSGSATISVNVVTPTNPTAAGSGSPASVESGGATLLAVTVTPGNYPISTGLTVTADLTSIGGGAIVSFRDDGQNGDVTAGDGIYSYQTTVTGNGGARTLPVTVSDAQGRSGSANIPLNIRGPVTILHMNDTHARLTPHKWIIPAHSATANNTFEDVGGAAFLAGEILSLTDANPSSLVIDGGDISEGNPIGDMNGNGSMTGFYSILSGKLKARRGRGMDAVLVGNHDVRDATYIANLENLNNPSNADQKVPVISMNVCNIGTKTPHFNAYTTVSVNGTKVGILGYTTQAAEVGASLASTLEVVNCDWNSTNTANIHIADYVKDLRNNQGCDIVILAAHVGHTSIATDTSRDGSAVAALLVDDGSVKLPEVAVTGHWHTWTDTVWQPEMLNYKTIFTESASYMKYVGELQVTPAGEYISSTQHVIRDADITPDPDVVTYVENLKVQYDAAHTVHVDDVIGYTANDLLLDNKMKWWSADEYPWSGNNTAGQWICDAMQWEGARLFGSCDLAIEAGGGVRADIPAGPVTYLEIYETFPWNDDTFDRINMTGLEIRNFLQKTNCDAGFSSAMEVTANDGIPISVKINGQAIVDTQTYTVCINNYMYAHPPTGWTWSDTAPLTNAMLCREGIVDFMKTAHGTPDNAYQTGGDRYHLNTEFSGGFRAVVTMMNDNDTKSVFEDAFIRLLSATPETLARRGSAQVPADLVNADGTVNQSNRLCEAELYRSFLGFHHGSLKPGDVIEVWGKGSFYGGNPEFVDQEGIYSDGVEFNIVSHNNTTLAQPQEMTAINDFWNDAHKNHYVRFYARKTGANTVSDQAGKVIPLSDATGYAAKAVPGNVGDVVRVTGVPTMENYAMRFRCDSVTTTAGFPPVSSVDPLPSPQSGPSVALTATVSVAPGYGFNIYSIMPAADSQVASGKPTTNSGSATGMYVQSANGGTYGNERAWMKFDLSGIPAGATISGATLNTYCFGVAGASMPAALCGGTSDTWTETGITWNTQPAFDSALQTQTLSASSANNWLAWDVTDFTQTKFGGNKLVSLVIKPVTENSADATSPSYRFDAKEYSGGSNAPYLTVTTPATGNTVTIASVEFFYRYSADNSTWGAWTSVGAAATAAPYNASFNYPNGNGFYQFYSVATDSHGTVETSPWVADATIQKVPLPNIRIGSSTYVPYSTGLAAGTKVWLNADNNPANTPIRATQRFLGYREVDYKALFSAQLALNAVAPVTSDGVTTYDYSAQSSKSAYLAGFWADKNLPILIGPDGNAYITDGHHTVAGYLAAGVAPRYLIPGNEHVVMGTIVANYYDGIAPIHPAPDDSWWLARQSENNTLLYGINGNQLTRSPDPGYAGLQPILPSIQTMPVIPGKAGMADESLRSMAWGMADGIVKSATNSGGTRLTGYSKTNAAGTADTNFVEFYWCDFLRNRISWDDTKTGSALATSNSDRNLIQAPVGFYAAVANGTALARSEVYRDQYGRTLTDYNSPASATNTRNWANDSLSSASRRAAAGDTYHMYLLDDSTVQGDITPSLVSQANNRLHIDTTTGQTVSGVIANFGKSVDINRGSSISTQWKDAVLNNTTYNSTLTIAPGTGTVTFAAANTYTGPTTIGAGTLALGAAGSIDSSASVTVAAGATFDTTAKESFAMLPGQPFVISIDGAGGGSAGRINASGLDITNAHVTFNIVNPLDDKVYVIGNYTGLTGTAFASVTVPSGYAINYAYNGNQIALVSSYAAWAAANAPGQSADQSNNGDGVPNGVKYFMGVTGSAATANPGIVNGSITWPKNPLFLGTYVVEVSPDLSTWEPAQDHYSGNLVDNGTSVAFTLPPAAANLFVRLRVVPAP